MRSTSMKPTDGVRIGADTRVVLQIAATLQELGKVAKAQGEIAKAEACFQEEQQLLSRLLGDGAPKQNH